jgi:hypothetical protein
VYFEVYFLNLRIEIGEKWLKPLYKHRKNIWHPWGAGEFPEVVKNTVT